MVLRELFEVSYSDVLYKVYSNNFSLLLEGTVDQCLSHDHYVFLKEKPVYRVGTCKYVAFPNQSFISIVLSDACLM